MQAKYINHHIHHWFNVIYQERYVGLAEEILFSVLSSYFSDPFIHFPYPILKEISSVTAPTLVNLL